MNQITVALLTLMITTATLLGTNSALTPEQAKAIAKEAYIYGLPMVLNYKTMYHYAVDTDSPEYKGAFNTKSCMARLYTPEDKAVVTPNSDTPYCMVWGDLRAEPVVLTIPKMEADRMFEAQLIDLFTHNYAYVSTFAKWNIPGSYLLAGPDWDGKVPEGITAVIPSETQFVFGVIRTQLFNAEDLKRVEKIQKGYGFEPLSAYLGTRAPKAATGIDFPKWQEGVQFDVRSFGYIDFMLDLVKPPEEEAGLMNEFAKIGLGTPEKFDIDTFPKPIQKAMVEGVKEGFAQIEAFIRAHGQDPLASAKIFGTRTFLAKSAKTHYGLDDFYTLRAVAAHMGLYGNSGEEAIYPTYLSDAKGAPLNAAENDYTILFKKGELPPVKAFWSLTMYDGKTQLLVDNPRNRYLLNSAMHKEFIYGKDGSLTLFIQHDSPGKALEPNWLPAPDGPFYAVMRLYGPKQEALGGEWRNPPMIKTK